MVNSTKKWCEKYGIPENALIELLNILSPEEKLDESSGPMAESAVQQRVRLESSKHGRLWRNNVGAAVTDTGSFVRFGLANESKQLNEVFKSSDLIGIKPLLITEEMVGTIVGQFWAREVKHGEWIYKESDKRAKAQKNFIDFINGYGGDAAFITDAAQLADNGPSSAISEDGQRDED